MHWINTDKLCVELTDLMFDYVAMNSSEYDEGVAMGISLAIEKIKEYVKSPQKEE